MARRNTQRRSRRTVPRIRRKRGQNVAAALSHIRRKEPYQVTCSQDPPSYRPGVSMTKTIHLLIQAADTTIWGGDGSPNGPAILKVERGALTSTLTINRKQMLNMFAAQCFSIPSSGYALFRGFMCMLKACAWSAPTSTAWSSYVRLSVHPPEDKLGTGATGVLVAYPCPTFIDSGSPSSRAKVSVSVPSPQWWSATAEDSEVDILVAVTFSQSPLAKEAAPAAGTDVGYVTITISFATGYDYQPT